MELLGVAAGLEAEADDGVLVDADQAAGLADAAAVGQVPQDRDGLVAGQAGVEQGRALALGEAGLAGAAAEQPPVVAGRSGADTVRLPWPRRPWSGQSGFRQQKRLRSSMTALRDRVQPTGEDQPHFTPRESAVQC